MGYWLAFGLGFGAGVVVTLTAIGVWAVRHGVGVVEP